MAFMEKSAWLMLGVIGLVGVAYGLFIAGGAPEAWTLAAVRGPLIGTLIAIVTLSVAGHVVLAIQAARGEDDLDAPPDERDWAIHRRAQSISGDVLGAGVIVTILFALGGAPLFWIVHGLIALIVAAEIVKQALTIMGYRRGG